MRHKILIWAIFFFCFTGLAATSAMAVAGRGAGVPVESLPGELRGMVIEDNFVPSPSFKEAGVIHALNGHVVVIHRATGTAYFGREGDRVYENDSLTSLADSRCRIKFFHEDVVTMGPDTEFSVDSYRERRNEGKKSSIFSMLKGKAMFYAMRLFRYRRIRFTLKTPTAVAGVRGTKFGAHVVPDTTGRGFSDFFSEDGALDVNGKRVSPGNMFRGRDGAVIPTPKGYASTFESSVEVKRGGEDVSAEKAGEGGEELAPAMGVVSGEDPGGILDITENMTDVTQQETGTGTETETGDISQGKVADKVSGIAMLIVDAFGQAYKVTGVKGPTYQYGPNALTGGAETHVAYEEDHEDDDDFKVVVQEQTAANKDMEVNYFTWGHTGNKALGAPHLFHWNEGGHYVDGNGNEYLSWGWWEHATPQIGTDGVNDYYTASGKVWEIEGDRTHPDYISYLHDRGAEYTYSGEAKGVIAHSGGAFAPHELSGPFSCHINFGTKDVSNLNIDVTGGAHSVHMTGNGYVENDGEVEVTGATGTIDGNNIDHWNLGGAVCGGKAEGVAGTWGAHDGGDYWAVGEFHGKR